MPSAYESSPHRRDSRPAVTAKKIKELRAEGIMWADIASRYARSAATLLDIVHGKRKGKKAA